MTTVILKFNPLLMNMNIRLLMRCLAGLSYSVIIGHQFEAFEKVFGLSFITFSTLVILFAFYLFAFVCQFIGVEDTFPPHISERCNHHCHKVQWMLVAVNLTFALVEFYQEIDHLTPLKGLALLGETVLILFPDYFLGLIALLFTRDDEDEGKGPKGDADHQAPKV
jgi:hypothetical protein